MRGLLCLCRTLALRKGMCLDYRQMMSIAFPNAIDLSSAIPLMTSAYSSSSSNVETRIHSSSCGVSMGSFILIRSTWKYRLYRSHGRHDSLISSVSGRVI